MRYLQIALMVILFFSACKKSHEPADTPLTGIWIKGVNAGDTLYFTKKDDKNILRYNASFNAALPAFVETEYSYLNAKPSIRNFMAATNDFTVIQSFSWIREGAEFEVLGYEIFPFMASMGTRFTYKKIQ